MNLPKGSLRIKTKDLQVYQKTSNSKNTWKLTNIDLPEAKEVIKHFIAHNNLDLLIDKEKKFLKGALVDTKVKGARINVLPDGTKLDKAYSLFSPHLTIHDEKSNEHWDVIYMNPNGSFAYLYTLEKKFKSMQKKYKKVKEFEKLYSLIKRRVLQALKDPHDHLALPVYTLLRTYMRVGNELYYKTHGHKGLTTLTKEDISINGSKVTFNYLGKDGVPRRISEVFPKTYLERLKRKLSKLRNKDFVFTNKSGKPLLDSAFKKAFESYCGIEFYPHLVRSYYATSVVNKFLSEHRKTTKKEVRELFLAIADKLGHKHFNKKKMLWEDNFNVTIHHYIEPELVERIKKRIC